MEHNVIFGAGYLGEKAVQFYGIENIDYFVDNDSRKWGGCIANKMIFAPGKLVEDGIDRVIVAVYHGRSDILKQLDELNVSYCVFEEILFDKLETVSKYIKALDVKDIVLCGAAENCEAYRNRIIKDIDGIDVSIADCKDLKADMQLVVLTDSYMHASNYLRVRGELPEKVVVLDLYARIQESAYLPLVQNIYENRKVYDDETVWNQNNTNNRIREDLSACVNIMNEKQPLFSLVQIETINRCNMTCEFCPANKRADKREYRVMEEGLFKKIIDELAEINYSGKISLFANNEPLLDDRIIRFNMYAKEKLPSAYLYIFTNGTLLTLEKYIELMDVLDELIIDNYSESLELIKPVKIIKDYIGDNEELIRKTTIVIRSPKEILTSRGGDSPNRKEIEKQENVSCLAPYQQLIIRPDGKVSLCCNDVLGRYTMGDLNEKTVSEIWYGEEFARVRKNLLSGRDKEAHCQYCDTYLWQWSMEKHKILAKV